MLTITEHYRDLNAQLHRERADYGKRGHRHANAVTELALRIGARTVLDYGCGKGTLSFGLPGFLSCQSYDPCVSQFATPPDPAEVVVCTDVLEHIEPDCLHSVLCDLQRLTIRKLYVVIATHPDGSKTLPDGRDPHLIVRPAVWWQTRLEMHFAHVRHVATGKRDVTFECTTGVTVVTWKWGNQYTTEHVNRLHEQVRTHYRTPHRFVALTDDTHGLSLEICSRSVPVVHANVDNPSGVKRPRCYRRLWAFSREAKHVLGDRVLSLDLDMSIIDDITSLVDRPEPFVIWQDPSPRQPYNGGMWLLKSGAHPEVWEDFNPVLSPAKTQKAGFSGSDQAWFAYKLPGKPMWTKDDGVISYQNDMKKVGLTVPPKNTRIIMYHGKVKPWDVDIQNLVC